MTSDTTVDRQPAGLLAAVLWPFRLPGRVLGELETIVRSVVALQHTAERHLASIDDRAGELVAAFACLQAAIGRLEQQVGTLTGLEQTVENRMEQLRVDLNTRLLANEAELHRMQPSIDRIARDVENIVRLLPDPSSGPIARLRDSLTAS